MKDKSSQYIKAGLYYLIYVSNLSNEFVDYLLNEADKYYERNRELFSKSNFSDDETSLADVLINLKRALNSVTSLEGLKKILLHLYNEPILYTEDLDLLKLDPYYGERPISDRLLPHLEDKDLFLLVYNIFIKYRQFILT